MRAPILALLLVLASARTLTLFQEASLARANPIRRVVTMLQSMQQRVIAEGQKEAELYKKFSCYCQHGGKSLAASISAAEAKISTDGASIKEGSSQKAQLEQDLNTAKQARNDAKSAVADATAIREKEAAAFASEDAEYKSNIAALDGAISAISKGMAGSFLQTRAAASVRKLALAGPSMSDMARQELVAFLSGQQGDGYAPQSQEILGILKQLKDQMQADLAESTGNEKGNAATYAELVTAKKKEIAALTEAIETKSKRSGELAVEVAMLDNDVEDTKEALAADRKFLADLESDCEAKKSEHEEQVLVRSTELTALADTIKILNDDDALELFKKTLPSPSLLQLRESVAAVKTRALSVLSEARRAQKPLGPKLDFLMLALRGKKDGFGSIITMIDDMVANLKQEQVTDDNKKEYCATQLDESDDKKKGLERKIADLESAIEEGKDKVATLKLEIEALQDGIRDLDKSVADSSEQRKAEHAVYTELMASDSAAKELIGFAKNRLNKFYNEKLYKAAPKRVLSEEERITVNMGGTLAPTAPPAGIAGTGITAFAQVASSVHHEGAPPPAPETISYARQDSNGVIAMMDLLVKDLDKEMQVAEVDEKNAQAEYEATMQDSAAKRADDSKLIGVKTSMKAALESDLEEQKEGKASATKELLSTLEYISTLHGECDWLMQHFDARKAARASEVDSLGNAKAVLSGADYSLL